MNKHIISSVDVSKCGQSCYNCDNEGQPTERIRCNREYKDRIYYCDEFENCCYKRLKRKEQECEELRNLFEDPEVKVALTDVRTGEREVWRKLGNKA